MSIKILATADLHLGKQSSDITGKHASTRFGLERIGNCGVHESVEGVVKSGSCKSLQSMSKLFNLWVGLLLTGTLTRVPCSLGMLLS